MGKIGEPDVGGQCVYIRELSCALAAQGTEVLAVTRDRFDGKPEREEMAPGAELIRIPCGPKRFLPKEEIRPYLKEFATNLSGYLEGDEIISSHFWDGGYVAGLLGQTVRWVHTSHSLGKRKLASLPEADPAKYTERITTETEILERCDAIIASTSLEKLDLGEFYGADDAKIAVIPPGVDAHRFQPTRDKQDIKRKLGFSAVPLVFTLGRLDRRKGFDLYLRAAARAREILGGDNLVQFVLSAGADKDEPYELEERDRLAQLITQLSLEESVHWLPVVSQDTLPLYYRAADLFVMPSRYELFGIVMLEAMASGVPVIATKFGGPPDVIANGEDGQLVDPTDIDAFAEAIVDLISNSRKREKMGEAARQKIEERFRWEKLATRHQQIYNHDLQ